MLKVAQIEYIKHLRDDEGLNISEIAQRTDLDWRTVRKYADSENQVQERPRQRRKRRALFDERRPEEKAQVPPYRTGALCV
ncbi:MAG: integrase catalytic subunit [Bacillota bacterium]|nr:MAG: integrase catalytic subunit [Bacillota bacterium]MBS3949925.1 hypothetical protein [Peptococcaceae bacterium]